jgi:hypothetical protein
MAHKKHSNRPATTGLAITTTGKQKLTKNQDAFNKLTKRIEKLQQDIERKQHQFDLALKIYGTTLHPAEQKMQARRRELITALWNIYREKRLSKTNQRELKGMLQYHVQEYFQLSETEPDKELQEIFSAIEGMDYAEMIADEKTLLEEEMKDMFAHANVDITGIDLDDVAALTAKLHEAREKIAAAEQEQLAAEEDWRQRKQKKAPKKKTAKQIAQEKAQQEVEEMKQKNIGTIYRQLAKLFHPDLEQDPEKKVEKEILMKELTAAYEAKNLHALLTLELRWIHQETNHLESLTEQKLAVYLDILREQARELERQKATIFYQPQYAVLATKFGYNMQQYPVQTVNTILEQVRYMIEKTAEDVDLLQTDFRLKYVKSMLKIWQQEQYEMNDDDDEDGLFEMWYNTD